MYFRLGALAAVFAVSLGAEAFEARVVSVHDGDTVIVVLDGVRQRIRVADIDAPELDQPYGLNAREMLKVLCDGQLATFVQVSTDRNMRPVCRVTCRQSDAATHLVRNGMAWVWPRFARKDSPLWVSQALAKDAGRGLWVDPAPVSPWDWRASGKGSRP